MTLIKKVRENRPLIHHLTNEVVMNFTANGLLAFGGSPIMAKDEQEVETIAGIADGILINIGTMKATELQAMLIAGKRANDRGIPVVLDPVGVAATPFRTNIVKTLLENIQFTAIKGNAGEMAYLVDKNWKTKGVESIDSHLDEFTTIAAEVAQKFNSIAIVTGKTDIICYENISKENNTGHEYLTNITGAGCLLGSIITACLTTGGNLINRTYEAVHLYGKAAELAVEQNIVHGPGTFIPHFIDALGKV